MAEFPVPLDNLIAYVKTLHPDGGPLENVSDAFAVSEQLDEQSDALLGYFVDQARRSGLPWSQIGAAMGVSKQAAQKRFVPGQAAFCSASSRSGIGCKPFSRFTDRAIRVLFAADRLAADQPAGDPHGQAESASTLPNRRDPAGGRVPLRAGRAGGEGHPPGRPHPRAGLRGRRRRARPAAAERRTGRRLSELTFDDSAKAAFREALKWALRMGHNYIGTEHLLLGVLFTGGPVAEAFTGLGLTPQRAEELITAELTAYVARLQGQLELMGRNRPAPEPGELRLRARLVCFALHG